MGKALGGGSGWVLLTYVPRERCVEMKSLKLYFFSFRNKGIFYEGVVNHCRAVSSFPNSFWPAAKAVANSGTAFGPLTKSFSTPRQ